MSVLKRNTRRRRHVGRRVAVVAAGVALIVVGLEAPAFAVTPVVTAFTPTAAPSQCVLQITGSGFNNPTASDVSIGGDNTGDFAVISDTEIWAEVPAGAGNGAVSVTNGSGTGSLDGFVKAGSGGGCVPTVTSFAPTCGPGNPGGPGTTEVTITGTNLLRGITGGGNPIGADVDFAPYGGALGTIVSATPTQLVVSVPSTASGTQPIRITTFNSTVGEGRLFTATPFAEGTCITEVNPTSGGVGTAVTITGVGFDNVTGVQFFDGVPALFTLATNTNTTDTITTTVPFGATTGPITLLTVDAPDGVSVKSADFTIGPGGGVHHPRNVTLKLSGKLKMAGKVKVPDGTTDCANAVPVKLQRAKKGGGWKTLKTVTTDATGAYSGKVRNKPGKFRSIATKVTLANGEICDKDVSPTRKN
jgi:IPT/TIG domain